MTKVVLCVSERDIVCTASLTCQMICLMITHALMVFCFSVGGRKISLARYESICVCIEVATIINVFVDPLVSLLFSSNFREAAYELLFPPKKKHLKSNFKRQNKDWMTTILNDKYQCWVNVYNQYSYLTLFLKYLFHLHQNSTLIAYFNV